MRKAAKRRISLEGRDGNVIDIEIRKTDLDSGTHIFNAANCHLDLMLNKHQIELYQHMAGDMFKSDCDRAHTSPAKAVELKEKVDGGNFTMTLSDHALDAQDRVKNALRSMSVISRLLVNDVVFHDRSIQRVAVMRGFSRHYVGPRFREALDELAKHYGLC